MSAKHTKKGTYPITPRRERWDRFLWITSSFCPEKIQQVSSKRQVKYDYDSTKKGVKVLRVKKYFICEG